MQQVRGHRRLALVVACLAVVGFVAVGQAMLGRTEAAQGNMVYGPVFEVDPLWPKPLPNHWLLGTTIGVSVDSRDHIWIIHRGDALAAGEVPAAQDPPTAADCCFPAPPVLEFDQGGTLVGSWGGPGEGYEWPASNHGIFVDHMDNVWIGGNGGPDSHLLKFTRYGQFLLQLGRSGGNAGSNDQENFGRVAKIFVDPKDNEAYIADGYLNKRVVVLDAETGAFKRYWGAYGTDRTTATWVDTTRTPSRPSSSATRCTAPSCHSTGWSMCATAWATAFRCSRRTARMSKSCSSPKTRWVPGRSGTSHSRATRTRSTSIWPTA